MSIKFNKKVAVTAFCLFLCACSTDYDIGKSTIIEHDRLVVNSLLKPANPISVYFYTTFGTDSGYRYAGVKDVEVLLKENGTVLFNGICTDTVLSLDHYPKAGAAYTIEASLPGYDKVTADTSIPLPIRCNAEMQILGNIDSYVFDLLINLHTFDYPEDGQASLWVTTCAIYENDTLQYNELYANNMLLDRINRETGMEVKNEFVGSIYYNAFLRIKNKNLPHLEEIVCTPEYLSRPPERDHTIWPGQIGVKLTAASREYDSYCRNLYEQKKMVIYDDDISAIVFRPIRVYSNIENGLGIFAGINETNYQFDYPERPKSNDTEWE